MSTEVTYHALGLRGTRATSGAEQVAAFSRIGPEASALVALGGAVDLGEELAVGGAFPPATRLTRRVARRTWKIRHH